MNSKHEFLKKVQAPNSVVQTMKDFVPYILQGWSAYNLITAVNANQGGNVEIKNMKRLFKSSYDLWYDYVTHKNPNLYGGRTAASIMKIKSDPSLHPSNMSEVACEYFMFRRYDSEFSGSGLRPMQAQNKENPIIEGSIVNDFMHMFPFGQPVDGVDCRLYLNIKPENRAQLTEELQKICYNERLRVYSKFWTGDLRNDSFLVYTNYNQASAMVSVLDRIRSQHPKLFEGCEANSLIVGTINGYIGFGEEPKYQRSSFNKERAEAMDEYFKDTLASVYRNIGYYSGTLQTSRGEVVDLEGYLKYRLEASFREHLERKQQDIAKGIYPGYVSPYDYQRYIRAENAIYRACLNELPDYITEQFSTQAAQIIRDMREGRKPRMQDIIIKTKGSDFTYGVPDGVVAQKMKNLGYFDYREHVGYDISKKLFNVFGVEKQIQDSITEQRIKPYFDKHHVSVKYPFLNQESERDVIEVIEKQ